MTLAKSSIKNIVLFLTAFSVLILSGCDQQTSSREAIKVLPPPLPTRTNFNVKVDKLTKYFQPDDPWEIIKHLRILPTKQDKFEQTSEFLVRMNSLKESTLFEDVKLNGYFAFKISNEKSNLSYNADDEKFYYKVYTTKGEMPFAERETSRGGDGVPTSGAGSPDAIDAYFKGQLKKITYQSKLLISHKSTSYGAFVGEIKASPAQAKLLNDKLSFYLVGKINSPYLTTSWKYPFGDGETVFQYINELPFQIEEIWVVNSETGNVLTKKLTYQSY